MGTWKLEFQLGLQKAVKHSIASQAVAALRNITHNTRGTFRQVPTRRIRLSFVECAYSDLRDIFFHSFRGLKWIPLWKRMAPNFKTTTFAHSRLSLILNNNNMAWSFVGKYEQVSTYVSWKIPLYQSYKR